MQEIKPDKEKELEDRERWEAFKDLMFAVGFLAGCILAVIIYLVLRG
jgi:hypothetical protein